jgi:hypothetical protein
MAVPTPYVAVAGTKASASAFNAGVKGPLDFLMSPPRCHVYNAAGQSIANAAALALMGWDSEAYDTDGLHQLGATGVGSTSNSRITFTTAGLYAIDCLISFSSSTYTVLTMQCNQNAAGVAAAGTILRTQLYDQGAGNAGPFTFERFFNAGDYIEFFIQQTSGGAKTTATSLYGSRVFARWVAIS